jgi:hypothetical protein
MHAKEPAHKYQYLRCLWCPRYCAMNCRLCKKEGDDSDKMEWWSCHYPKVLYDRLPVLLVPIETTDIDEAGNIFITDEAIKDFDGSIDKLVKKQKGKP